MIFYLVISKNMKQQKFNSHKANGSSFLYIAEFNFAQIHTVIFFFPRKYYIKKKKKKESIISDHLVFWAFCIQLAAEDLRCCQPLFSQEVLVLWLLLF